MARVSSSSGSLSSLLKHALTADVATKPAPPAHLHVSDAAMTCLCPIATAASAAPCRKATRPSIRAGEMETLSFKPPGAQSQFHEATATARAAPRTLATPAPRQRRRLRRLTQQKRDFLAALSSIRHLRHLRRPSARFARRRTGRCTCCSLRLRLTERRRRTCSQPRRHHRAGRTALVASRSAIAFCGRRCAPCSNPHKSDRRRRSILHEDDCAPQNASSCRAISMTKRALRLLPSSPVG